MSSVLPSPRTRLLVALCAALAVIIIVELGLPVAADPDRVALRPVTSVEAELAALNQSKTALPALDALTETRERPVFVATRRVSPAGAGADGRNDGIILGRYRLMGVVITPQRRTVVVKPARGGKTTELRVGSKIDGWTVDQIAPEFMKLTSSGRTETISLVPKRGK
jgi:hypothetical protein